MIAVYPHDSAQLSPFVPAGVVLSKIGPGKRVNAAPALNITADLGATMSLIPDTAGVRPAQPITDPLIQQARFLNEAAALDRALAMRKALRPRRSASAAKGWESRRG